MDERVVIERANTIGDRINEWARKYEPGVSRIVWALVAGCVIGAFVPWLGIVIAVVAASISALVFWAEHYQPKE